MNYDEVRRRAYKAKLEVSYVALGTGFIHVPLTDTHSLRVWHPKLMGEVNSFGSIVAYAQTIQTDVLLGKITHSNIRVTEDDCGNFRYYHRVEGSPFKSFDTNHRITAFSFAVVLNAGSSISTEGYEFHKSYATTLACTLVDVPDMCNVQVLAHDSQVITPDVTNVGQGLLGCYVYEALQEFQPEARARLNAIGMLK